MILGGRQARKRGREEARKGGREKGGMEEGRGEGEEKREKTIGDLFPVPVGKKEERKGMKEKKLIGTSCFLLQTET